MFIIMLFIISNTWKQPRYPSVSECINKPWDFHIKGYRLVTKEAPGLGLLMQACDPSTRAPDPEHVGLVLLLNTFMCTCGGQRVSVWR